MAVTPVAWPNSAIARSNHAVLNTRGATRITTHTLHAEVPVDKIDAYVKANPHLIIDDGLELKDTPILKYRVGVNPNDLTSDTLANALDNLTTKPFGCGKECSILEAFRYVSVLDFWHS